MRNRIVLLLILILLFPFLCIAAEGEEEENKFEGFGLSLSTSGENSSVFEIGFSTNEIDNVSDTVMSKENPIFLTTAKKTTEYNDVNYYTATDENTYLYWKIVSPEDFKITLETGEKLSTTRALSEGGEVLGEESENATDSAKIEWTIFTPGNEQWPSDDNPIMIIEKNDITKTGFQAAGSFKFVIKARLKENDIYKYKTVTYSSSLIAKVVTK